MSIFHYTCEFCAKEYDRMWNKEIINNVCYYYEPCYIYPLYNYRKIELKIDKTYYKGKYNFYGQVLVDNMDYIFMPLEYYKFIDDWFYLYREEAFEKIILCKIYCPKCYEANK